MSLPTKFEFPNKTQPEWATYCEYRHPQFKIHNTRGQAHSAISYHWPYKIGLYHFENGDWILSFEPPEVKCVTCGKTDLNKWGWYFGYVKGLKKWQRPAACRECYVKHFGYKPIEPKNWSDFVVGKETSS